MNNKQAKVLAAIFEKPVRPDIRWEDVRSLLVALGADVKDRKGGSHVSFELNGVVGYIVRPHPQPTMKRWAVREIAVKLEQAGVQKP